MTFLGVDFWRKFYVICAMLGSAVDTSHTSSSRNLQGVKPRRFLRMVFDASVHGGDIAVSTLPAADILGELFYVSFLQTVSPFQFQRRVDARCAVALHPLHGKTER